MQVTYQRSRRMRFANRLFEVLQRRGIGLGSICLLTVRGRSSGALHSTPVIPVEGDGDRWLVAAHEHADWVRNARAERWAILTQGRCAEIVQLVELKPERSTEIVEAFAAGLGKRRLAFVSGLGALRRAFDDEAAAHPVFEVVAGPRGLGAGS